MTSKRRDSIIGRTPYAGHAMVTPSPGTIPVILVADDSPDIRTVLTMLLEDEGYSIVEATDGRVALEVALDRDVNLILLTSPCHGSPVRRSAWPIATMAVTHRSS